MTGGDYLVVVASVVGVLDGAAVIDRGLEAGLQRGDAGTVYYELTVAGQSHRVDAGTGSVTSVDVETAELTLPDGIQASSNHRVEFRLPAERLTWKSIMSAAGDAASPELLARLVTRDLGRDEELARKALAVLAPATPEAAAVEPSPIAADSVPPVAAAPAAGRVMLPAGVYEIGLSPAQAERYNQQPRFTVALADFAIDATTDPATHGLSLAAAAEVCSRRGGRLPTELEWETASQALGFDLGAGFYEWTTSPYGPYPGNDHHEPAYEGDFFVLRGDLEPDDRTPYRRRFLQPHVAHERVAARCVYDELL